MSTRIERVTKYAELLAGGATKRSAYREAFASTATDISIDRAAFGLNSEALVQETIRNVIIAQASDTISGIVALTPRAMKVYEEILDAPISKAVPLKLKKEVADKIVDITRGMMPKEVRHTHNKGEVNLDQLATELMESGLFGKIIEAGDVESSVVEELEEQSQISGEAKS